MNLTPKQQEVLTLLDAGNPDGTHLDLDQLLERLSYRPTKAAVQFTVRSLVGHGLIFKQGQEVRRDRMRVILAPTVLGQHYAKALKPSLARALIED